MNAREHPAAPAKLESVPLTLPTTATPADYNAIVAGLGRFWDGSLVVPPHHPLFVREFAGLSLVIRDEGGEVVAYLVGLLASADPVGYIHIVGVRDDHRRIGLGAALYREFEERVKPHGATKLRAITWPGNQRSVAFHEALGFSHRLVEDYRGAGEHRFVFEKSVD